MLESLSDLFLCVFWGVFSQGSLEDGDQPDLILDSGRSQLLTDRDPVLSERCDTAGKNKRTHSNPTQYRRRL